MSFCQLAQAKSLREISQGLACCEGRLRHLGVAEAPARLTLSYANRVRPATLRRWNLFSYRDLWAWLDRPVDTPPHVPPETQLALDLNSIPAGGRPSNLFFAARPLRGSPGLNQPYFGLFWTAVPHNTCGAGEKLPWK